MISSITGTIQLIIGNAVEVDTASGLGYAVRVPLPYATELHIGQKVRMHTYLKVSEQASDLYGFKTTTDRSFFLQLLGVSGVGPKTAIQMLSGAPIEQIQQAIAAGDVAMITSTPGIGKKTAERIVVELKGKVDSILSDSALTPIMSDALSALESLGYSASEARKLVEKVSTKHIDAQAIIKEALQKAKK